MKTKKLIFLNAVMVASAILITYVVTKNNLEGSNSDGAPKLKKVSSEPPLEPLSMEELMDPKRQGKSEWIPPTPEMLKQMHRKPADGMSMESAMGLNGQRKSELVK